jgi:hypothetical protein
MLRHQLRRVHIQMDFRKPTHRRHAAAAAKLAFGLAAEDQADLPLAALCSAKTAVSRAPSSAWTIEREPPSCVVRRWDIRPKDWHRIWPELIGAAGAPQIPTCEPADAKAA